MTVLASLLFQNTPTGRVVEPDLNSFDIYEDLPPDVTSFPGLRREHGVRRVRQGVRPPAPPRVRARSAGRVRALSHPRRPADRPAPRRGQRVAAADAAALAARGDDVPARRGGAPGVPGRLLRQPLRRLPRRRQRPSPRRGAQARISSRRRPTSRPRPPRRSDYSGPPSSRGSLIGPPSPP